MANKTKLIQGMDNELWKRFKVYCVIHDVAMGKMLNNILKDFLNTAEKNESNLNETDDPNGGNENETISQQAG